MTAYGTEFFSMRDVNRLRILQDVIDRNLRPGLAAEMLGITPRHCSRLLKRYRQSGPLGMNNQARSGHNGQSRHQLLQRKSVIKSKGSMLIKHSDGMIH